MITIADYGLGNIKAFLNVFRRLNISVRTASTALELENADKIILPGVGSFDYAMSKLNGSGMRETLDELVLAGKVPVLGICVGMQMMAGRSEEGLLPGLSWIEGKVRKFDIGNHHVLPHMGWNTIQPVKNDEAITRGITPDTRFYFLHSYYFECDDASNISAQTQYGVTFSSFIRKENIYGIQFHPEKSHSGGMKVLSNFATL